jgi:hypothetical protein
MRHIFIYLSLLIGFSSFTQARFQPTLIEKVKNSVFPIVLTNNTSGRPTFSPNQRRFGFATNPMMKSPEKSEYLSDKGSTGFYF